ncbi:MAG: response regulator transcription factor [Betaproteobacteria bacterium]|nr:response regulator transcription factor [Betaproteobacteria bacterium]
MKILVVDDHALVREGLRHALGRLGGEIEVIEARSGQEALDQAASHPEADLVLLDLHLPGADGFSILDRLRAGFPALPVIVLSGSGERSDMLGAIERGAMGFIPKSASSAVMLSAMRLVLSGGVYLPPEVLGPGTIHGGYVEHREPAPGRAAGRMSPADIGLTGRQAQVLALMVEGKSNKIICRELGMAEGTVKIHVTAVLKALKVCNRTQAVIAAARLGLAPDPAGQDDHGGE